MCASIVVTAFASHSRFTLLCIACFVKHSYAYERFQGIGSIVQAIFSQCDQPQQWHRWQQDGYRLDWNCRMCALWKKDTRIYAILQVRRVKGEHRFVFTGIFLRKAEKWGSAPALRTTMIPLFYYYNVLMGAPINNCKRPDRHIVLVFLQELDDWGILRNERLHWLSYNFQAPMHSDQNDLYFEHVDWLLHIATSIFLWLCCNLTSLRSKECNIVVSTHHFINNVKITSNSD